MSVTTEPKITVLAPDTSIQQLFNYAAISETMNPAESLCELIIHALFTFEENKVSCVNEIAEILKNKFGVNAPNHQIENLLDKLTLEEKITRPLGTNYTLVPDTRRKIKTKIDQAVQLQERVKMQWATELIVKFPDLDVAVVWAALLDYLAKAFLRHGMQVVVFLDPLVKQLPEYSESLLTLLSNAVQAKFTTESKEYAKKAISDFIASVSENEDRARFIAECAEGAANYFSLEISPEVAFELKKNIVPFKLFCDTNFLFGILDLHVHHLEEVSKYLLEVIEQYNLPITLCCHEKTLQELQNSISYHSDVLRKNRWTKAISRAASTSINISGIELKYHQKNAENDIDVETFFRPYQHVDVLLKEHKIEIYKSQDKRFTERFNIETEYQEYAAKFRKEKSHGLISHDAELLDCVRLLREQTELSTDLGALLVTCDYMLYRFDNEKFVNHKTRAVVVLPNVLCQILRPFISVNHNFNRLFSETFAIPEFRTIGNGASKASSKMLSLLAAYKNISEKTVIKLLSNDVLIDKLRDAENEEQFKMLVESAIMEEYVVMERQVDVLKTDNKCAVRKVEQVNKEKEQLTDELSVISEKLVDAERNTQKLKIVATCCFILLLIVVFELFVYKLPWPWLKDHSSSYSIQAGIWGIIVSSVIGYVFPQYRNFWWSVCILTFLVTVIPLLGGPTH